MIFAIVGSVFLLEGFLLIQYKKNIADLPNRLSQNPLNADCGDIL